MTVPRQLLRIEPHAHREWRPLSSNSSEDAVEISLGYRPSSLLSSRRSLLIRDTVEANGLWTGTGNEPIHGDKDREALRFVYGDRLNPGETTSCSCCGSLHWHRSVVFNRSMQCVRRSVTSPCRASHPAHTPAYFLLYPRYLVTPRPMYIYKDWPVSLLTSLDLFKTSWLKFQMMWEKNK